MEMYLQFGHGMMAHTRELLSDWAGGGVILSPRDLTEPQLQRVAQDINDRGGEPFLDPQCFARTADHPRLTNHTYWEVYRKYSTSAFRGGVGTAALLSELARLSRALGIKRHILPGLLAPVVNDDWFSFHDAIVEEAPRHFGQDPLIATIALSSEALRDEAQVESIVDHVEKWGVAGLYVVPETPSAYLVDDPVWMANLLILASGLKLAGKSVIVGYCSHQMLCLACANVDAIASGTWLNVRAFAPDKFFTPEEDDVSRRATWYYCPHALSEYKIPFLDIARRVGILDELRPDAALGSSYADPLFGGAAPTTVDWGEQAAFRHYLTCLHSQAATSRRATFDETVNEYLRTLARARASVGRFRSNGVLGGDRDFSDRVDVNQSALTVLARARGPRLRRGW